MFDHQPDKLEFLSIFLTLFRVKCERDVHQDKLRTIYPTLKHGAWELCTFKAIIFQLLLFCLSLPPSTVDDLPIERIPFNVKVEH